MIHPCACVIDTLRCEKSVKKKCKIVCAYLEFAWERVGQPDGRNKGCCDIIAIIVIDVMFYICGAGGNMSVRNKRR